MSKERKTIVRIECKQSSNLAKKNRGIHNGGEPQETGPMDTTDGIICPAGLIKIFDVRDTILKNQDARDLVNQEYRARWRVATDEWC
jgi:hypothetical protein